MNDLIGKQTVEQYAKWQGMQFVACYPVVGAAPLVCVHVYKDERARFPHLVLFSSYENGSWILHFPSRNTYGGPLEAAEDDVEELEAAE